MTDARATAVPGGGYSSPRRDSPSRDRPEADRSKAAEGSIRRSYKKVADVFNALPSHFAGRIRDVDHLLAKVLTEVHTMLTLSVHEIAVTDPAALSSLEESPEWDDLLSDLRKTILEIRKQCRTKIAKLADISNAGPTTRENIHAFVNLDQKAITRLTGIAELTSDTKRGLSDIVSLLGSESESKIDHWSNEKTIKVRSSH